MSLLQCCIILFISATGGWMMAETFLYFVFKPYSPKNIIGISLLGIIPAMQPILAKNTAESVVTKYINTEVLESKLADPSLMLQLKPEIEMYVDRFLAVKLPEIFPLLSKMMGEKTLSKFKEAFLAEAETIFPALMKSYGKKLPIENAEHEIEQMIKDISIPGLKNYFYKHASVQILQFKMIGLICGIFMGVLQILLIMLFY